MLHTCCYFSCLQEDPGGAKCLKMILCFNSKNIPLTLVGILYQGTRSGSVASVTNSEEQQQAKIKEAAQLLIHAQGCNDAVCQIRDCQKARGLLNHVRSGCRNHDCPKCFRFRRFLKEHTRLCKGPGCALEHCSQSSLFKGKRIADDTVLGRPAKRSRSNQ